MLRWLLLDLPAAIVTLWFRAYYLLIALVTIITVSILLIALVLALFGVRWGW